MTDRITFARAAKHNRPLAKRAHAQDGRIVAVEPAPQAGAHRFRTAAVDGLASLMAAVQDAAVRGEIAVRAEPLAPVGRRAIFDHAEHGPAGMRVVARRWAALDLDGIPIRRGGPQTVAIDQLDDPAETWRYALPDPILDAPDIGVRQCQRHLPPEFRNISCVWQLSASAGLKPGWRLRLWFWHDRAVTGEQLRRRFLPCIEEGFVDPASFVEPQPIYLSVSCIGGPDPAPARFGIWRGASDVVTLPDLGAIARRQAEQERAQRERISRSAAGILPRDAGTLEDWLASRVEIVAAARQGQRHPTYKTESCRIEAACRRYGLDYGPWQTRLIEAYESTLSAAESRERKAGSIIGMQTWLAARRSA